MLLQQYMLQAISLSNLLVSPFSNEEHQTLHQTLQTLKTADYCVFSLDAKPALLTYVAVLQWHSRAEAIQVAVSKLLPPTVLPLTRLSHQQHQVHLSRQVLSSESRPLLQ